MEETASAILHNGQFYLRCFSFIFSRTKHGDENGEDRNLDSGERALSTAIAENSIEIQRVKIAHFLWYYSPPNRDLLILFHPPKRRQWVFRQHQWYYATCYPTHIFWRHGCSLWSLGDCRPPVNGRLRYVGFGNDISVILYNISISL